MRKISISIHEATEVLACRKCNLEKGKNTEEEFVKNKEAP